MKLFICCHWLRVKCVWSSVPDESPTSEDRSSPASSENSDSGLFLLKKDSERRAILYKVLNEDQDKVTSNLMENHIQVCIPAYLTVCVVCLNHTMRTVFMSFRVRRSWSCLWTTSSRSSASYGTLYDALSDVSWQWPSRNSNWTWTSTAHQSTRSSWFCLVSRTLWVECRINSIVLECYCTVCNLSFLPSRIHIKSYLCNIYICKTLKTDVRHTVPFERFWILEYFY